MSNKPQPKLPIKIFTVDEYFEDFEYITNSHLKNMNDCPYFYEQKSLGKVPSFDKDYFIYGKAVDVILSGESIDDRFYIGSKASKTEEEMLAEIEEIGEAIKLRAATGTTAKTQAPLKSQLDKIDELNQKIDEAKENKGKQAITLSMYNNAIDTAREIMSQPLYQAFQYCDTQLIIGAEINGIKVKGMLDKVDLENGIINDDKSAANLNTFDPQMYIQQLAWYRWIVREVYGVDCSCYLSVGDKGATQTNIKRSSIYMYSKNLLDYQEEENMKMLDDFVKIKNSGVFIPCVHNDERARERTCFSCDYYSGCCHSRQSNFIII